MLADERSEITDRKSTDISAFSSPHFCFGLVNRKERWGLSWRGWGLVCFTLVIGSATLLFTIFPFLAVTQRTQSDVLVVEGWIPEYAIRVAAAEFASGNYRYAFTTGGPVQGMGGYVNDYSTAASIGAGLLKRAGVADVQMVPSRVMERDRTYGAAMALREWFRANDFHPRTVNVVTEGAHARRTRLLFQKALGDEIRVGVISIRSPDYDGARWWRYSEGLKDVLPEAIAYVYVTLFFREKLNTNGREPFG